MKVVVSPIKNLNLFLLGQSLNHFHQRSDMIRFASQEVLLGFMRNELEGNKQKLERLDKRPLQNLGM